LKKCSKKQKDIYAGKIKHFKAIYIGFSMLTWGLNKRKDFKKADEKKKKVN